MMKIISIIMAALMCLALVVACAGENGFANKFMNLKDGVYSAKTAPDVEGYFVAGTMRVEKGKIVSLDWEIRDKARGDKLFDDKYGPEVYAGNQLYQQQCRDNLAGMPLFVPRLIETQDLSRVDAVTGATWAHNEFQFIVAELVKKAKE